MCKIANAKYLDATGLLAFTLYYQLASGSRVESGCLKIASRPVATSTFSMHAYRFVSRLRTFANRFHLTSAGGVFRWSARLSHAYETSIGFLLRDILLICRRQLTDFLLLFLLDVNLSERITMTCFDEINFHSYI